MQISSSLPIHVARAYGVTVTRPVAAAQPTPAAPAESVHRAAPPEPLAHIERTAVPGKVNQLIAGAVPGAVSFDGSFTPIARQSSTLKLYTRAADTIEAATGIQIGRSIDVTG